MTALAFGFSLAFFIGMVHNLLSMQRPGIYPPKKLIRRRAEGFAAGGAVFLLLGMIISLF